MKKSILYFLLFFLALGCIPDDGTPNPVDPKGSDNGGGTIGTFTVKPLKSEYAPFEVADLEMDIDLSKESYKGTFNDSEILLLKNEEGNLSFLVPELPEGSYKIKVFVDETEGSSSVSIVELKEIENVDAFLEENLLSVVDKGIAVGNTSTELDNQELVNEGLSYLNEFHKEYINLNAEQKRVLAHVMENNQIVLSGLFNEPQEGAGKGFDWDSQVQPLVNGLLISKSALVVLIGGIVVATYGGQPLLGLALVGLAMVKYSKVVNTRASILDAITIPILNDLNQLNGKSQQGKTTDLNLTNDAAKNFDVISKGRGLIKSDLNHPNQKVVNTVSTINESDKVVTDLQQKVQKMIDLVGSFFSGRENKIEKLGELPESAAEEIITVALEHFFIEDQLSDIEVGIVALNANTLQIKFTSASNEPTQFTAKFIYDDGDFRTETALNVNLGEKEENSEVDLMGSWRFLETSGSVGTASCFDQSGTPLGVTSDISIGYLGAVFFNPDGSVTIPFPNHGITYSQSNGKLTMNVTLDHGKNQDIYTFSGTWDAEKQMFIGAGSRDSKEWFSDQRLQLSCETFAEFELTFSN